MGSNGFRDGIGFKRQPAGVTAAHRRGGWAGRGVLAGVLLAAIFLPGQAVGAPASGCASAHCKTAGTVRWVRPLPGAWSAQNAALGTIPVPQSGGQAYAASGENVVAIGFGMTVYGYRARNGAPLWATQITGFPVNSAIVSVRVWAGVVTAGVSRGPLSAGERQSTVVLGSWTGQRVRSYRAAPLGGAVTANSRRTVVIGPVAVTSYANATGRVNWSRPTGGASQDWRSDGGHVYVAQETGGDLGAGPVTALRRISVSSGTEQVIRPRSGPFDGRLSAVLRQVVLFSSARGVTAYSATTGHVLWRKAGALPESVDVVQGLIYLTVGNVLTGVLPGTGQVVTRITGADGSGSSGVLGVRGGVALGLDQGAPGDVWGYDVTAQRVIWTTRALPWPHYFVDLSGIGGSADPVSGTVILTTCAQRIQVSGGHACQTPELVAIDR